jgi:hypothetical protein
MTDISWLWSIDWSFIRTSLTILAILFAKRHDNRQRIRRRLRAW